MPELLLDQIRSPIRDRIRELEPAARKHERLDAALTALGGPSTRDPRARDRWRSPRPPRSVAPSL